jgi:prolyl-tRNA editing enzyme YbaK/EbsC (Cys-tRNA(Pro) deacylase)
MSLKPSAQRIQDLLAEKGHGAKVIEMPDSTRTAEDAAAACGCSVAQIGKSLVFRIRGTDRAVLAIASGTNRVHEKKLARVVSDILGGSAKIAEAESPAKIDAKDVKIDRADADFVRTSTGFAIGGVPPFGHRVDPITLIDEDLMRHAEIWCAAGTPNAVFPIAPADLLALTGGTVADIRKD